jgi:O-acetyl-ADP-ribose deacetylase (regulator of RNase III)
MPTTFTQGDLFGGDGFRAMAQGCNCAGAMGAGIAVEFKRRFPRMFDEYRKRCKAGLFALGDVMVCNEKDRIIFNLATQQHWKTGAELPAITKSVGHMVSLAERSGIDRIGIPRIGAGLGGLPWPKVRDVLKRAGDRSRVELVVFETYVPA